MTPRKPIVGVGPVAAPVVRTGGQLLTGGFLVEGLELFLFDFTAPQTLWLSGAASLGICFVQNLIEKRRGRKLIGA